MRKRVFTAFLFGILAFSFVIMTPTTVRAYEEPNLGDVDRIEFFDTILDPIFDNTTLGELTSSLLFDGKVAYITFESSYNFTETNISDEFYGVVYTGVTDGSGYKVYLRTNASMDINQLVFSQDVFVHLLIWDADKSFINFLNELDTAIEEEDMVHVANLVVKVFLSMHEIMNGDEVFIIAPVFLWQFNYDADYAIDNQYVIDNEDDGPYDELEAGEDLDFTELDQAVKDDLIQVAAEGDPTLEYLMNDTAGSIVGSFTSFFYLMQEIWLKRFWWDIDLIPFRFDYDFDIVSVRHLLFKTALYNDTDDNGLMDISFNETAEGLYYPYSTEAVSWLELVNATGVTFGEPQIDETPGNEQISWNATLNNPMVRLTPYGVSSETGLLTDAPVVPMEDSSIGFTFSPQTTGSGRRISLDGVIKIDQKIGGLNGTAGLDGVYENLDLAIIYLTDVFELTESGAITIQGDPVTYDTPQQNGTAKNDQGTSIPSTVSGTTSATESLDFLIGSDRVAGLNLTGAKYSVGSEDPTNPTHDAKGAVVPWSLYQFSVEQTGEAINQRGAADWNLSGNVVYSTYFYEICYPDYNGSKIVHDPVYFIYGDVTYPPTIPGFEYFNIILGLSIIGCLVLLIKKKEAIEKI
jgi:hypothetical protein